MRSPPKEPLDVMRILAPEGGWAVDRPTLSTAEIGGLASMVEPGLTESARETFELYVQHIFSQAVQTLVAQKGHGGPPIEKIRKKLDQFIARMESAESVINCLDANVRKLIDHQLQEMALRQRVLDLSAKTSIELWRAETSALIGLIVGVSTQLKLATVKGESRTAYRQMVRGLLALVHDVTGALPKRHVTHSRRGAQRGSEDNYWFLHLARRLADLAHARATVERTTRNTGERRKGGEDVSFSTRQNGSAPAGGTKARPRKMTGSPKLTQIVREELDAREAESSGKRQL